MKNRQTQEILIENLKALRKARGWSQMKLAEKSGLSAGMIGEIETAKKYPSLETLDKIAGAMEIPTYQLIFDNNCEFTNELTGSTELKKQLIHRLVEEI